MFDKLIESDSRGAEFKNRGRYFAVSSVVVGILFLSAVMFSLYAAEIGLGNDEFELSAMLAPPMNDAPEPKQPKQTQPQAANNETEHASRKTNMLRPDEIPKVMPTEISSVPSANMARPPGEFVVNDGPERGVTGAPSIDYAGTGTGTPNGTNGNTNSEVMPQTTAPPPPPVVKPRVENPNIIRSIGVVNGNATSLPKPPYPAPALLVRAEGNVSVQVTIDERGKVISSKAVSGHVLLKGAAEKAAWSAKFTPTLLSNVPVKVTGVIVYKFSRN